jgi:hypothetical protein
MNARGQMSARIVVPSSLLISLVCRYRKKDTREAAADVEERELADNIGDSQLYEGNQENGDRIIFSNPLADGNIGLSDAVLQVTMLFFSTDDHRLQVTVKTQSTGGESTLIL